MSTATSTAGDGPFPPEARTRRDAESGSVTRRSTVTVAGGRIAYERATVTALVAAEDIVGGDEVVLDRTTTQARRRRPGDGRYGVALHAVRFGGSLQVARRWITTVPR